MKKEIYFGLSIMVAVVLAAFYMLPAPADKAPPACAAGLFCGRVGLS
jgi:hypothetical protein